MKSWEGLLVMSRVRHGVRYRLNYTGPAPVEGSGRSLRFNRLFSSVRQAEDTLKWELGANPSFAEKFADYRVDEVNVSYVKLSLWSQLQSEYRGAGGFVKGFFFVVLAAFLWYSVDIMASGGSMNSRAGFPIALVFLVLSAWSLFGSSLFGFIVGRNGEEVVSESSGKG